MYYKKLKYKIPENRDRRGIIPTWKKEQIRQLYAKKPQSCTDRQFCSEMSELYKISITSAYKIAIPRYRDFYLERDRKVKKKERAIMSREEKNKKLRNNVLQISYRVWCCRQDKAEEIQKFKNCPLREKTLNNLKEIL